MDNAHCHSGPSNSRSPFQSPRSGQGAGGKAVANNFASSSVSGMSSKRSPLGNKTVAFCKAGDSPSTRVAPDRGGPRLRAEGNMVPPASDAATLRRQVAALQIDLEAHIDGEQRLQCINQQLRERLEVYMKQNHENVERAETELNTLHEDMEQTLELQRRLAQRATALEKDKKEMEAVLQRRVLEFENERTSLQTRIQSMGEDLRAKAEIQEKVDQLQSELSSTLDVKAKLEERLDCYAKETALLKKKADDYSNEVRCLILKEQLEQKLDKLGRKAMVRRAFMNYQAGVRQQCIDRTHLVQANKLYRYQCCKKILLYLQTAAHRSSIMRRALDNHSKAVFNDCWRSWKVNISAKHMGSDARKRQNAARLYHSMHVWVAYIIRLRGNPERYGIAVAHWNRKCLQNFFDRWLWVLQTWRLGPKEEKILIGKATRHHDRSLVRHSFESWQDWLKTYAVPKRRKFAEVQAHINMMTMKQATAAWRCIVYIKWVRRMKFKEAAESSKTSCIKRTLASWQRAIRAMKIEKIRFSQAIAFRATRTGRHVLKCWRNYLQHSIHMRIYRQMAFRHYLHRLYVQSMQNWKENVIYKKAQQRATTEVNQALTRAAMVFWRDYHVYESIKKKKDHRATIHVKRKYIKLAKRAFRLWWEQVTWKRKVMQLDNLFAVRRRRTLLIQSLHIWLHATFEGLLVANAKFHEDLLEAQAHFEEQKHQVTTVDVENLQLIDRLHTMSAEVAYLNTTINEKEKLEKDLHRALEDGAILENSMRHEIEQQRCRCEELECEIQGLQRKLQMKNAEDTAGEIHHTLEIQNLEQSIKELRIQLADKTSQIDSYEKALKETAERLEGASDESQEKLTSAFEIAGSLRKLLEERESQYATLEGTCRRRELELGEVQRKLTVANCTLCETVDCRDARILELESMLSCKQQEVTEVQQQLQNMELAMDFKESRVRKLEYEIKLMSEQTALKTKAFVSSLNSWSTTPLHHDSLRNITKESLRQTYEEAKSILQQQCAGTSLDGGALTSASYAHYCIAENQVRQERDTPSGTDAAAALPDQSVEKPPEREPRHQQQASEETLDQDCRSVLLYQGQDHSQPDWETSFALVSTTRPAPGGGEPSVAEHQELLQQHQSLEVAPLQTTSGEVGGYRIVLDDDPNAVDSLHLEIQRLQARIMSRLRDSAGPPPEDPANRSGSRPTPRPPPDAGPWSSTGRSWDSR